MLTWFCQGGKCLLNYDNQVFVCSPREVYCLVQLPFKKQVFICMLYVDIHTSLLECQFPSLTRLLYGLPPLRISRREESYEVDLWEVYIYVTRIHCILRKIFVSG